MRLKINLLARVRATAESLIVRPMRLYGKSISWLGCKKNCGIVVGILCGALAQGCNPRLLGSCCLLCIVMTLCM